MPIRSAAAGFMALVLLMPLTSTAEKKAAQILRIGDRPAQRLEVRPTLATADTCQVRHDSGAVWAINGWVIGNELYKEYLDPGASCTGPYPFTVTEVAMQMYFTGASPLLVSVDVEGVDNSVPNCPFPGNLLAISSEYQLQVPGAGLYEIWVPLDTPQVVTGPFFAGFFIGNTLDPAAGGAVVTDSFPILCTSYNIWDTSLGYVDLCDNTIYNFPGRLVLFASGIPGGSGGYQPPPALDVTGPDDNDTLYASVDLWAWDTSGSNIIDYVSFEYSTGGGYSEFGRDYDGLRPLRDGVDAAGVGDGFSLNWDFSARTQGFYKVRATAYDTLGRKSSDSINVYLEPTPPIARVTSPADGSDFCSPLTLLMTTSDENLTLVEVYRRNGTTEYSSGLVTLDQSRLGDVNHNPLDGNHASNGEFGDYYCGPVAGTLAIRLWFDRGYNQLMRAGFDTIPMDTVAERLAVLCKTRQNRGTYDENLLKGIKSWVGSHGGMILFDYARRPDYFLLRQWVE
ncbi:MAG TPA: hypothetical protein VN285_11630, partial [Candidatus Deferrimicrobium sp.]|nr:hypothetical protein [Candidatus Deferrimicrobium sp.]